jgi:hypothetical protein
MLSTPPTHSLSRIGPRGSYRGGEATPLPTCSRFKTSCGEAKGCPAVGPFSLVTPKWAVDLPRSRDLPVLRGPKFKSHDMDRGPCARLLNRYVLSAEASLPTTGLFKLSLGRSSLCRSSIELPLAGAYPQTPNQGSQHQDVLTIPTPVPSTRGTATAEKNKRKQENKNRNTEETTHPGHGSAPLQTKQVPSHPTGIFPHTRDRQSPIDSGGRNRFTPGRAP